MSVSDQEATVGCIGIILLLILLGIGALIYRSTAETVNFTVDRRERIVDGSGDSLHSYYLVWSKEGEVFKVDDSLAFMTFSASDTYGRLRENSRVTAKVAGWRVQFFSMYRNIVEIKHIEDASK